MRYLGLKELVEPVYASGSALASGILNLKLFLQKCISIYIISKHSEQSLQWLEKNSLDKMLAV